MQKSEWLIAAPLAATNSKADTNLYRFLIRLTRGEDLTLNEAADFFQALTDRNANPAQIAGVLTALTAKGETFEEMAGMAHVLADQAVKIKTRHSNFINISGAGSSTTKTFNVSTAAAFVAAGAGLPVAKNTDRAVFSSSGSAEVLDKLGINVMIEPKVAQACLDGAGLCFLFTPKFYPSVRRIKDISRNLGIRTVLNLLETLTNPGNAPKKLIGVWHSSLIEPVAKALAVLNTERAWVVHGEDGLDEITLAGETAVTEVFGNKIKKFSVTPEDFGLKRAEIGHLISHTSQQSATIIREVLEAKRRDEARSLVVINAAAALIIAGLVKSPMRAARMAEQSIDSRSAQTKLERLVQTTNR